MSVFSKIINEVLYEESKDNLKAFYQANIFIQDFPNGEEEKEEEQPQQAGEEEAGGGEEEAAESTVSKQKTITEDIFQTKVEGIITLEEKDAKSILTLNDLLEYLKDQEIDNRPLMSDLVIEVILGLTGDETQRSVNEILSEGDRCNITLDYGFSKDDSIGIQVSKNPGVKMATVVMRKDGKPVTGKFSMSLFNQTITNVFLKEI